MTCCVLVTSGDAAVVAEALRAAIGLGLRGDRVEVFLGAEAQRLVDAADRADVARAIATLQILGHDLRPAGDDATADALRAAHAVEVWT